MSFIQIQAIIFFSIIICSIIGGKKASLMASAVWIIETVIIYKTSKINYLQIISVSLSFQMGMLLAIVRDFIVKKFKKTENKEVS
ncbi:hypothetical protein [uncultured Clostridium sp.]|uniref:hypothetical protein n=1 Tax=uncultured Clostridium sp. TaxID=59620 RepID=UPI0025CC6DAC|nr:hypothetical protein [uncultured Clostridium sp.]MDU4882773.1 hypothetical protein [Clostridium celatum]MDU7075957.1 hypothetical protein [Clostridium celatum]